MIGFKSFLDPTKVNLTSGLTGVVGPNGCGKSNIVEAIKWVMGENSPKQMRSPEMNSIIFSGTNDRPSRNFAEVIIKVDNSEKKLPYPYTNINEIEISRKLERDKGSTYKINGKNARARDVQLIFADSGTGSKSSGIVGQGVAFCGPEYNGGSAPILTNAITWISVTTDHWRDAFSNKNGLVATHSGGDGSSFLSTFRQQLEFMGVVVYPRSIQVNKSNKFDAGSTKKFIARFEKLL